MEEGICFAWIGVGWFAIDGDEEGGEFVFDGCGGGQDIADLPVFQNQGVGDEGAVTAPWDGFGAHDGGRRGAGNFNEGGEAFSELRRDHIVGVSAEGGVAPAGVDGVLARVAAAAEVLEVRVADVGGGEGGCEGFGVELRHVAGFGDGANVDQVTDSVSVEERDELFDGVGGVADGEENGARHDSIVMPETCCAE
jgi:hypothetical protein